MPRTSARPTHLTVKQEAFCHAYLRCGNASRAYREAYDVNTGGNWISSEAHCMLKKERIQMRIEKLRESVEELTIYDINNAMLEAKAAYDLAKENLQSAAMVSAVTLRAKLAGLLVDRRENVGKTPKDMSREELEAELQKLGREIGFVITSIKAPINRNGKATKKSDRRP